MTSKIFLLFPKHNYINPNWSNLTIPACTHGISILSSISCLAQVVLPTETHTYWRNLSTSFPLSPFIYVLHLVLTTPIQISIIYNHNQYIYMKYPATILSNILYVIFSNIIKTNAYIPIIGFSKVISIKGDKVYDLEQQNCCWAVHPWLLLGRVCHVMLLKSPNSDFTLNLQCRIHPVPSTNLHTLWLFVCLRLFKLYPQLKSARRILTTRLSRSLINLRQFLQRLMKIPMKLLSRPVPSDALSI